MRRLFCRLLCRIFGHKPVVVFDPPLTFACDRCDAFDIDD